MKAGKAALEVATEEPLAAVNLGMLTQQMPRQSPRWCQLTTTLLSLVVHDSQRTVDLAGLAQFLEVIHWRAHGKVTGEEFSILYNEWMTDTKSIKKRSNVSIAALRAIALENRYLECDLDLFVGILVHELNTRMLNTTIGFGGKKGSRTGAASGLEVVTDKWLSLSEELFFCLDTPGYGALRFEECYFYSACLLVGLQGWKSEPELEADLALSSLTSLASQLLRDCGAAQPVTTARQSSIVVDLTKPMSKSTAVSGKLPVGKQEITLSMFKKHLIKKAVCVNDLTSLISHTRRCTDLLLRLARQSGAENLALSCQPYELRGAAAGGPRLWQEAVLLASGFQHPAASTNAATPNLPPILLFLLSDAEKFISLGFRAIELPVDEDEFLSPDGTLRVADTSIWLTSPAAANEELHDNANRLYNHYRKWLDPGQRSPGTALLISEMQRDPVHRLIVTSLMQYKQLQALLSAALFDLSISVFGSSPLADPSQKRPLAVLCATLLPNNRSVLVELGLEDTDGDGDGDMQVLSQYEDADPTSAKMQMEDLVSNPDSISQHMAAMSLSGKPPSLTGTCRRGSVVAATRHLVALPSHSRVGRYDAGDSDSELSGLQPRDPDSLSLGSMPIAPRISSMPVAKRRTSLVEPGSQVVPTSAKVATSSSVVKVATATAAAAAASAAPAPTSAFSEGPPSSSALRVSQSRPRDGNGAPNYLKPTSNFTVRASRGGELSAAEDEARSDVSASKMRPRKTAPMASLEKEAAGAEWKPVLARNSAKPVAQLTAHDVNFASSLDASSKTDAADEEAVVLSRLLTTGDPQEQVRLIEQLRRIKANQQVLAAGSDVVPSLIGREPHGLLAPPAPPTAPTSAKPDREVLAPAPPFSLAPLAGSAAFGPRGDASSAHSDAASSSIPSSIAEMLQQGQSPGRYAAMLRDILRKMSRDDSNVRIKSLEQVLKLGQEIVHKETVVATSPTTVGGSPPAHTQRGVNLNSAFTAESLFASAGSASSGRASFSGSLNLGSNNGSKVILRANKVPGVMPDRSTKRTSRAFGHPVDG